MRSEVLGWVLVASLGVVGTAQARVTQLEVVTQGPAFEGQSFGAIGPYERVDAIAHFAVDPKDPALAGIVNLQASPVNEQGEVEFSTQVTMVKPVAQEQRSAVLFYEVPNRGRSLSTVLLNRGKPTNAVAKTAEEAGDGFLMEQGHTLVWSGWQRDIAGDLIHMNVPVAAGVQGFSREEVVFDKAGTEGEIKLSYPAANLDPAQARLLVRQRQGDARRELLGAFRYVADNKVVIERPADMDAGAIYEFIYPARNAVPEGLGFVATRDVVSFLRGSAGHAVASPVQGIEFTLGFGISQSGRFLRDMVAQGFNADAQGARVFDGAFVNVAGSRKTMLNVPFSQAGRYSRQHEDHDYPGDEFPFSYADSQDGLSGKRGSIFSMCEANDTCPKLMHSDSSTEFWQARSFLVNTSTDGRTALTMPENVRLYLFSNLQHFSAWQTDAQNLPACAAPTNPISQAPVQRALVRALTEWVVHDAAPPPSVFPSVADGTLVPPEQLQLPRIAGEVAQPRMNVLRLKDYSTQPPTAGAAYPTLVPRVDATGKEMAGVHLPFVQVPLATSTGWNLRADGFAAGDLCSVWGASIPLPQAAQPNDSRASLQQLYPQGLAGYLSRVNRAITRSVQQGFVLESDRALLYAEAVRMGRVAFAQE